MYAPEETCNIHNGGDPQLEAIMTLLPFNQGGNGRHKCPYCAYYKGFDDGFNFSGKIWNNKIDIREAGNNCEKHRGGDNGLEDLMTSLLYNQGGIGRHRCPYCSYYKGFEEGVLAQKRTGY